MIRIAKTTDKCINGCDTYCNVTRIEIGTLSFALCEQCRQELISDLQDVTEPDFVHMIVDEDL